MPAGFRFVAVKEPDGPAGAAVAATTIELASDTTPADAADVDALAAESPPAAVSAGRVAETVCFPASFDVFNGVCTWHFGTAGVVSAHAGSVTKCSRWPKSA